MASASGRTILLVAVSNGDVKVNDGGPTWHTPTNGTGALGTTDANGLPLVVRSAVNIQKLWFADGTHWKYYDPGDDTVHTWAATAGSLPVDDDSNAPRLICTWGGRTVLSGLLEDESSIFMSAVDDPTNWDYSPVSTSATDAVAFNDANEGAMVDIVTAIIPYSDDTLVIGEDHHIHILRGDPGQGGQISLVTDVIGMCWGLPWAKDPYGTLYFFSNFCGIYRMVPGELPVRISNPVDGFINGIDTGANIIRMIWDDRFQGLHVFVTLLERSAPTTHLFWEQRSGAWETDVFDNPDHNPLCCVTYDGDAPQDRMALIGSWDGYVRCLQPEATDDDGTAIASAVVIGPFLTPQMDDMMLETIQAILGQFSGTLSWAAYVGATAELALASAPAASGSWTAGRSLTSFVRRSGHAIYVKLTSSNVWMMEMIKIKVKTLGMVRQRGF